MPCRFRLIRFRSPLLTESLLFSLPRGTEMVHFPRFAPLPYFIQAVVHEYCSCGFPHSEICGSKDACSSPQLIAACHVLHRLEVPRHPPCALSSLTVKLTREQRSRENLSVFLITCLHSNLPCYSRYSIVKEQNLLSTKRRNFNPQQIGLRCSG